MEFLNALIRVSEKAANVARIIRKDKHLFELLVQKKNSDESNPRFVEDFKTLADVLIQEMVKHDIGKEFPEIKHNIAGEENNTFCNRLGESITVEIKEAVEDTALLLENVLNGDKCAASLLATEVHRTITLDSVNTRVSDEDFDLDLERLGIWIDPIDSTSEYINGVEKQSGDTDVSGLRCVTVLIGAFDKQTKEPMVGILNQPFLTESESEWRGHCVWGVATDSHKLSSLNCSHFRNNVICLSSSEEKKIKRKLDEKGFTLVEAAGAGYKILRVISGLADAYVLTKDSTFEWDTCGPHAILKSLGGDMVNYAGVVRNEVISLTYTDGGVVGARTKVQNNCNNGGFIAYRDPNVLRDIIKCLVQS